MDDNLVTLYNCETNDYDELVSVLKKNGQILNPSIRKVKDKGNLCNTSKKASNYHSKTKLIKSVRNSAHLSEDYWQNPTDWSNYRVKDKPRKKLGAVNTVPITDTV